MPYSKHLPKILTEVEVDLIEKTILKSQSYIPGQMGDFLKQRDITSFKLMYYTGLRPAECYQLKWDDLDFNKKSIAVRPYMNKRKNDIPAVMTPPAEDLLQKYKNIVIDMGITNEWLFPSFWTWKAVAVCTMQTKFNKIAKEAGLNKIERRDERGKPMYTYNLYSFRHSFATYIYKKTRSEIAVARLCRHTQVESASIYTHLCHDDKLEIARDVWDVWS